RRAEAWTFHSPLGHPIETRLLVPGLHNARNAIAAVAALAAMGLAPAESAGAVSRFSGVGRRFEHKGTVDGIDVVDDYAHHPDEIAAVVAAARMQYPGRRVFVVHQPHTYSRTKALLGDFAAALDLADEVVLLAIYPGGETDDLGTSSSHLLDRLHVSAQDAAGPAEASAEAVLRAVTGDVILTLGAGDITRTGSLILEQLMAKAEPAAALKADNVRGRTTPVTFQIPGTPQLKVIPDAPMSMYTTMRVGGPADLLVRAPTPGDVVAAVRWAVDEGLPVTVIGGGSNLLAGDAGIRGLVIVARTPGERAGKLLDLEDGDDQVRVSVGAQAPLSWVGRYCAEHGWAGMDWGVGLPGQIGGATVNNAGAHGTELKDNLVGVELLHMNGEIEAVGPGWLEPTYRMTRIKDADRTRPWIVLRSIFELPKHDSAELVSLADEHAAFRKRTQPTGACSGSTFANPEGDFAGRLLEAADLKGHRMGAMQLSPKHANWVVNTGGGTAREAWELIRHAQASVFARFGVLLRPEIERLGEPWDDDDGRDSGASPAMKGQERHDQ
ncbi:MAG: UDP-N-acetylmuramate dehydrogenase, partial [Thermomicrobiales bacterium]